jgi:hypothetical protein
MPLEDIPEIPPHPRQHSVVLYPILEVSKFRSTQDQGHDTRAVDNFGTLPPNLMPQPLSHAVDSSLIPDVHSSAIPECSPIPARHEVAMYSFAEVSGPIPDMDAGSQPMNISFGPQDPALVCLQLLRLASDRSDATLLGARNQSPVISDHGTLQDMVGIMLDGNFSELTNFCSLDKT